MATLNVTKDIQKLAEEAERNKNNNLTLAGLGLGSGFVASQTGGSAKNPNTKLTPLQQQIAENDALNRQKTVNAQTNTTPKPVNPEPQFKRKADGTLDLRSKASRDAVRELENIGQGKKPAPQRTITTQDFDSEGRYKGGKNYGKTIFSDDIAKLKQGTLNVLKGGKNILKGASIFGVEPLTRMVDEGLGFGKSLTERAGNLIYDKFVEGNEGLENYFAETARNPDQKIGLEKIADTTYGATVKAGEIGELPFKLVGSLGQALFTNKGFGNPFEDVMGLDSTETAPVMQTEATTTAPVMQEQRVPDADLSPEDLKKRYDYENRSPDEQKVIDNMIAGRPVVDPEGQTNQQVMDERAKLPSYQQNFLTRKDTGAPITSDEFKRAQFFAINQGMTFDPEIGYSEAEFPYQMYKGQTIGDFLQGETLPEQFRTAEREADPLQAPEEPTATEAEDTALTSRDIP